jgi:hypothetical protein
MRGPRLTTLLGIGPITASLIIATVVVDFSAPKAPTILLHGLA